MTDLAVRVENQLQLLEGGATPVPVVKDLAAIATESGISLGELVDPDRLRSLCIRAMGLILLLFVEGKVLDQDKLNFGTFCAHFRGQVMGLQRLLGEHKDFEDFMRHVEQVGNEAFPIRRRR